MEKSSARAALEWIRRNEKLLAALFSVTVFALALRVLWTHLAAYRPREVAREISAVPRDSILLALGFTVLSYLVLSAYDSLALRYIRRPLSYRRTALASFSGYAVSNNLGLAILTGAPVRYRLYSAWGLSAAEVAQVMLFNGFTFWLGFLSAGALVFLIDAPSPPAWMHLPFATLRPLGVFFLLLVALYAVICIVSRRRLSLFGWRITTPSPRLAIAQIVLSIVDWLVAAAVLYALLPDRKALTYPSVLGAFLLAQVAGLLSQVPGGLGVFESIVVALLSSAAPASEALGALVVYRGIYYLLPLITALGLLAANELARAKARLKPLARILGGWTSALVPNLMAATTFVAGAVLLVSGSLPAMPGRIRWMARILPLPVFEISHFLGSLAGVGLLMLARGLQRRVDAAWHLALTLLAGGAIFSLLKGFDYEEALILGGMFLALLPCRREFPRKSSLWTELFTPGWIAATSVVLIGSLALGLFAFRHVEYRGDLWWRFTIHGDAPRFLRAMVGSLVLALGLGLRRFLQPSGAQPALPAETELARAKEVLQGARRTQAQLVLLGDKRTLFSESGRSFLMYGIEKRAWVALGDPVGDPAEMRDLAWSFRELSDAAGGWSVFYQISPENLDVYADLGLLIQKIGEEARVPLEDFSLEGRAHKPFRHVVRRLENEGCSFEIVPPESLEGILPEIQAVSDAWLRAKSTREKGFSLGYFSADYVRHFPAGIVRREGRILAFSNIWLGADGDEISVDLMRHLSEAPPGIMDYLFTHLMLYGRQIGYHWFNLGMAPLSGLSRGALAPFWHRTGNLLFHHGEHFYNFQGLRAYKEKFGPRWEPRYLASPGGLVLPIVLTNLATLISRGIGGVIRK